MSKAFSSGNVALVNGALFWAAESGAFDNPHEKPFFSAGYPITPVNEVTEYLGRIAPELGGVFIQAESEIAAANMLIGAASVNVPAITVTSSPGMSLMQEAISYAAGMELGGRGIVYVDVVRGGPGLGNIQGAQSDFNQAVLGGGHGDYQNLVLAPASAQEMFDFTRMAFKLSATYRLPGFILADGYIGQLKESYQIPDRFERVRVAPCWDIHSSIFVREGILEQHNWKLYRQFQLLKNDPDLGRIDVAPYRLDEPGAPAKIVLVNYGIFSRIGYGVVDRARAAGLPVGQISLKSLNPFPEKKIRQVVERYGPLYVMEGSINQLHDRLRMTVGLVPIVGACQRPGGTLAEEREIVEDLKVILEMVNQPKYRAKLDFWKELYREPVPFRVNRGNEYEKIGLRESSHEVEYKVGMEGKSPENRPCDSMTDKNTYFCTGCDHKHSTEALGKLFDRLQGLDITLYSPVGCSIFLYNFFKKDRVNHVQVPHGRGPAAASASKHARPDHVVICYQGDGDALDIGVGELIHAAARGENITVVLMNNGTYGMTGGQLSSTTPLGQFSKTTPRGRQSGPHGFPLDLSKLLNRQGVSYYRRTLLGTGDFNKQFSDYLMQGVLHQMKGRGMSVIEVIATCVEHQRAPKEILEAFEKEGKRAHQIALSKEYTAKTMVKAYPLDVGWGEDYEDPQRQLEQILSELKKTAANPGASEYFSRFKKVLNAGGILSEADDVRDVTEERNLCFYLCGEGGQGLQSLADILMRAGGAKYIHNLPWYEPEVTKARTVAAVILSKNPYLNPNPQPGEVDVLLCMTPKMYREKKHFVRKGGLVLVDTLGQPEIKNGAYDYQLLYVPATQLAAEQLKERRSANIVLLGALNQTLELFSDSAIEKAIRKTIPKIAEINIKAYYLGKQSLALKPT